MKRIELHDKKFEMFIRCEEVTKAIKQIAEAINNDLKGVELPLFISVLNGSFMFTGDLMKYLDFNCELSFIKMSSYSGLKTSGNVNELIGLTESLEGRTVVILEDIVDSGNTLEYLKAELNKQKPKNLRIATLLFKPDAFTKDVKPDYIGIEIPDKFIVGYGLDYNGLGRNYPDIYVLSEN